MCVYSIANGCGENLYRYVRAIQWREAAKKNIHTSASSLSSLLTQWMKIVFVEGC